MAELREMQLDILDKIHAFCMERGIRYSLGGGTLLGAVRHKGYIPWDDDIDIMMPRPDYERFLKEFEGMYPHYVLQHYKNDDMYYFPFAKVFDERTVLIEESTINGIYVDVFPIDGLPDKPYFAEYCAQYKKYVTLLCKTNKYYKFQKNHSKFFLYVKYLIKSMVYPSKNKTITLFEDFYNKNKFESSQYAGAICGVYGENEIMESRVFKNYTSLFFEGRAYMAISDYKAYLTKHYGDYMILPPIDKQISHHLFEAYWK